MPKITFWTLMGLAVFLLVMGSILPSFFLIFGVFFIAFGLYIGSKPEENSRKKEILDSLEIPVEIDQNKPGGILKNEQILNNQEVLIVDDQNKSSEVSEGSDKPIRQSKAQAIKMKIKDKEEKPEVIVVPKEEKKAVAIAIPKEDNKLENQSKEVVSFFWGGGFGPLGWMKNKILSKEQVVEKWSILVQNGDGKAEEILKNTEFSLRACLKNQNVYRSEKAMGLAAFY